MTLFLDACTLIYWIENREPWRSRVVARIYGFYQRASAPALIGVSRLAMLECLVQPLREGNREVESTYRHFFASDDLRIVELTPAVVEQATNLWAEHRLKTPDALHAASALSLSDEIVFLTNDRRFDQVPGLHTESIE